MKGLNFEGRQFLEGFNFEGLQVLKFVKHEKASIIKVPPFLKELKYRDFLSVLKLRRPSSVERKD